VIYILALAVFLIGTIEYIITGVIEMIVLDLKVSTSVAGLLVTAFALSAAIGVPILIATTINVDRKKVLITLVPHSPDIALSVNTSFIQFGFAFGSGLGGLVIGHSSILHLNWLGLGVVSIALLLALLLFTKMNSHVGNHANRDCGQTSHK
jgi:predicted MFS family arabinose efflux permease